MYQSYMNKIEDVGKLRNLKPFMVSGLLFANAVAVILANPSNGYLFEFKKHNSYFSKNLSNEVYLSCLDFEKQFRL